jgi:DNA-binding CsgD family transcriptional regulator
MRLNDIGPWSDVAALHLPCPAAEMPNAIKAEANFLLPLVGRAIDAARTLNGLSRTNGALIDAFDLLDFGVAICEPTGRIVIANAEFRSMAADRDGLSDFGGTVGTTQSSDRKILVETMAASLDPKASSRFHVCRLGRRSRRLPLIARAIPIRGAEIGASASTLVMLLVVDPEACDRVSAEGIDALGVLSQAELEVCDMIVRGQTTAEIATRRGTSVQTSTDQIKSALAKLACTTRLDIVRLAMATRPPGRTQLRREL